ncbi:MAG: hypothetical protein LUD19_06635 [Clostridia bacterium]|nr:hypothetical protein [Clostridia bacterium]
MKKINIFCIVAAIVVGVAVIFPGCTADSDPDSVEIDGSTYVNGFYDDLYFSGFAYREYDTASFETDNHYWWKVEEAPFEMYCAQHKEKSWWSPVAYCKENELDAVTAYYADIANYDYYIGIYADDTAQILLDSDVNTALLESAISKNIELDNATGVGGIFDPYKDIKITISYGDRAGIQPVLYRVSNDGLFTTVQSEWIIYDNNFYIFGVYDGSSDTYSAYKIDEEASEYIIGLFSIYGLYKQS